MGRPIDDADPDCFGILFAAGFPPLFDRDRDRPGDGADDRDRSGFSFSRRVGVRGLSPLRGRTGAGGGAGTNFGIFV